MPLFEYTCEACQSQFELLVRGSEKPKCPECGSAKLEKAWSVPAAHTGGKSNQLPVCGPMPSGGGCGLPQCGTGGCHLG
ncbi:zinc ribbon domain-containing protein [Blastopirellula marina]|uniref:Zinc ribbon domain-containing protein n=1 Tax=Blastopirellula marina TaxID=124 RepID=A0A2S8F1X9_9BACT|nr:MULTISPECIES: zinc ribbon domain-containing protein [Pirellulaceae]PQO26107.1 zinc ribbon domain-containing protein [Blastopirellula marina]RCS44465.1 zinc ribbon domain-containing protein [Bremerella cremea]